MLHTMMTTMIMTIKRFVSVTKVSKIIYIYLYRMLAPTRTIKSIWKSTAVSVTTYVARGYVVVHERDVHESFSRRTPASSRGKEAENGAARLVISCAGRDEGERKSAKISGADPGNVAPNVHTSVRKGYNVRAGRVEVNRGTTVSFRDERQVDRSAGLRLPTRGEAGRGGGKDRALSIDGASRSDSFSSRAHVFLLP